MTTGDEAPGSERLALARAHYAAGEYREALTTARAIEASTDAPELARCLACGLTAECLIDLGDAAGALLEVERGRRQLTDSGAGAALMVLNTAEARALVSMRQAEEAIRILEPIVHRDSNAVATLAEAYCAAGRYGDALTTASAALELSDPTGRARGHVTIALAALAGGELARADAAAARAIDVARAFEQRGNEGWALAAHGAIALARSDRATAQQRIDEAQEIAEELGMMPLVERCRALLRQAR